MTGLEAALQEERDKLVRQRREAIQANDDEAFRLQYREEAIARINTRHSQQQQPSSSSSSSESHSDSNSETGDVTETAEALQPRRPRRGVWRTQKLIDNSQIAKEVAISKGNCKSKGRKLGSCRGRACQRRRAIIYAK